MLQPGSIYGQWRYERRIGKGGFGAVSLWTNQSQKIVIKQCITRLNASNRKRWEDEVTLMNETHHENLVAGLPVPQEIVAAINAPEKLLGLEFCDCDLRKVLSNVHHCCGLQEEMVLGVLKDISSGLDFLHRKSIMHRDLKPENILLKQTSNGTNFKIADLGYAKQMDAMSICQSFVGTLQYLAPELYQGRYGYAADYWSFGTLVFECITGTRPFYLTDNASQWPILIGTKSDFDIWGRHDEIQKKVVFYRNISLPNHLCQPLLDKLKEFLQLVLRHSPDRRGNTPLEPGGPCEWYMKVTSVLDTKIISLFDVHSCSELSYVVESNSTSTFMDVKKYVINIKKDIDLTMNDLVLINKNGKAIDNQDKVESYFRNSNYKLNLYLFRKKRRSSRDNAPMSLPERLRELLGETEPITNIPLLKRMMYQAYHCCCKIYQDYTTLTQSFDALLHNMKELKDIILKNMTADTTKLSIKLEASMEMYRKSYDLDKKFIHRDNCTMKQREALRKFDTIDEELKDYATEINSWKFEGDMKNIEETINQISNNAIIKEEEDGFKYLKESSEEVLRRFKESTKDKKIEEQENMKPIVMQCIEKRDSIKSFYDVLKKAMKCREEISQMTGKLVRRLQLLKSRHEQVIKWQVERQELMWILFRVQSLPGQHQASSDFLLQYDKILEQQIKTICQPPVHDLVTSLNKRISRLQKISHGQLTSPKKLRTKSSTFDAYPYESNQEPISVCLADFKRRPSEPIYSPSRFPDNRFANNYPDSGLGTNNQSSNSRLDDSFSTSNRSSKLSPIPYNEEIGMHNATEKYGATNMIVQNEFTDPYFRHLSKSPSYWDDVPRNRPPSAPSHDSVKKYSSRIAGPPPSHHIESVELDIRQTSPSRSSTAIKRDQSEKRANQLRALLKNAPPEKQPELRIVDHGSLSNFQLHGHGNSPYQAYNSPYPDILQGNIRHAASSPSELNMIMMPGSNSTFSQFNQQSPVYDRFMLPVNGQHGSNIPQMYPGHSEGRFVLPHSPMSSPGSTRSFLR